MWRRGVRGGRRSNWNRPIRRYLLAVAAVIAVNTPVTPVEARWNRALPKSAYIELGRCETGWSNGRFYPAGNTAHRTRSYVGAFGWAKTTFALFADTPHQRAHTLTWEQQVRILDRTFWYGHTPKRGPRAGIKQWAVGPWGHGCFRKLRHIQVLVCKHPKHAIRRWCR